jgi:hypothetical protein
MDNKTKTLMILLGLGAAAAIGAVLFWPKEAKAAPLPTPQPKPGPAPAPSPQNLPPPQPAPVPGPQPAPVPIPPKLDPSVGPGSQIKYDLIVTGTGVNVRTGPGTNYPVIRTVTKGDKLMLPHSNSWAPPTAGAPQGWTGAVLPDGKTGWIASQYLEIPN